VGGVTGDIREVTQIKGDGAKLWVWEGGTQNQGFWLRASFGKESFIDLKPKVIK
jgi:hypothetical protein